jgi:hypothetical protein
MSLDYGQSVIMKNEKNFMTTTVGAVNAFEEEFADLLADQDFCEKFKRARKKAFDIGNDQKRRSTKLLGKSNISRKSYDYDFRIDGQMSPDQLSRIIGGN